MTGLLEELFARVDSGHRRLVEHIAGQVDTDGAVRGRCGSRVLESALMLVLLRKENLHPDIQNKLTRYLRHTSPGSVLDTAVIEAVANGHSDRGRELVADYLTGFDHYTGVRKRMLLNTMMALLGLIPHDQDLDPEQIPYGDFATWTNLTLCAIKVLTEHARGGADSVDPTDRAYLLQQLSGGSVREVWEGNVLAHLIALHAVAEFQPRSKVVGDHIRILARVQNPDGGMPFIDSQDIFLTATAGLALTESRLADAHAARTGHYIAARQEPDGGWGYAQKVRQTDTDDTAWCIDLLRATDPVAHRSTIDKAERYLTTMAGPDGGFPTYLSGHAPEPAMTAGAILALTPVWAQHAELLRASAGFLLGSQHPDGTFERSWTLSASSAIVRVVHALDAVAPVMAPELRPRIAHAINLSRDYLEATRNSDGGWGHDDGDDSDVLSTAQALPVLTRFGHSDVTDDAVRYLLDRQQDNGGFTSIPDQVGPRPFAYDFPVLADIMTLHALNQWRKQSGEKRPPPRCKDVATSGNHCASQAILIWHGTSKTSRAVRPIKDKRRARAVSACVQSRRAFGQGCEVTVSERSSSEVFLVLSPATPACFWPGPRACPGDVFGPGRHVGEFWDFGQPGGWSLGCTFLPELTSGDSWIPAKSTPGGRGEKNIDNPRNPALISRSRICGQLVHEIPWCAGPFS